jgi:hypothetical protein
MILANLAFEMATRFVSGTSRVHILIYRLAEINKVFVISFNPSRSLPENATTKGGDHFIRKVPN